MRFMPRRPWTVFVAATPQFGLGPYAVKTTFPGARSRKLTVGRLVLFERWLDRCCRRDAAWLVGVEAGAVDDTGATAGRPAETVTLGGAGGFGGLGTVGVVTEGNDGNLTVGSETVGTRPPRAWPPSANAVSTPANAGSTSKQAARRMPLGSCPDHACL
jgi:hypothetical protein